MTRPNTLSENEVPESLPPFTKTQSPKSFLYTKILKNYLGEQAAYVYALLVTNERLSFKRLLQISHLKPSHLRKILVSLVQLNCVVYYPKSDRLTDDYAGRSGSKGRQSGSYYYYHNEEGCLKLTYADDIIRRIRKEYDDEYPATIVQNVLSIGHLTIRAFLQPLKSDKEKSSAIQKAFKRLVDDKWLSPISKNSFLNEFDRFNKTFKKVVASYNSENPESKTISQTKRMSMIKELTGEKFLEQLENVDLTSQLRGWGPSSIAADDDLDTGLPGMINPDIPLTFNFERYLKRIRSAHLASEARHRVGEISSKVYSLILNRVELKSRSVRSEEARMQRLLANLGQTTVGYDPYNDVECSRRLALKDQSTGLTIRVPDIYRELKSNGKKFGVTEADLLGTIYDPADTFNKSGKRPLESNDDGKIVKKIKVKIENDDDDDEDDSFSLSVSSSNEVDPKLMTTLLQHMKLLATDGKIPFLVETSPGVFYVPFTELIPALTKYTFKQYLRHILGPSCLRVYNCIEEQGLTDEKNLAKHILMKENDIRSVLSKMQKFRLIEVQEIPKTQDRSAMRASFAFRIRYKNGLDIFKNSIIFNMGEVLDSLDDIKMDNKILLDKVSRDDVRGREQELLLAGELQQLQKYYEYERQALAKFSRMRSAIDVFEFMNGV
ncbi:DEKNAAC103026 [Brettanomyces naardenensis]|uniref:DNA-directed RNA polymerase III subunit RPC3 n=1 Tax=Brettanomyces naardenensis TaxID=13370 RepID=A0A448YMB4_BRENA|nr:DEKNAAC103026 [Brettanomyces naardenensis]